MCYSVIECRTKCLVLIYECRTLQHFLSDNALFQSLRLGTTLRVRIQHSLILHFITKQIFLNMFYQSLQIITDSINNSIKLLGMSKSKSIQADANKVSLKI